MSEFEFDPAVSEKIARVWRWMSVPVRPSTEGLTIYRKELESVSERRVMLMGATPELVDLALVLGSARVLSMDISRETIAAMKSLSKEDWGPVELICGNWLEQHDELQRSFDFVCCDGGCLFLTFPEQCQRLFEVIHSYLFPGGKLVTKVLDFSGDGRDHFDYYAEQVDTFESKKSSLPPDAQVDHFCDMVTAVATAAWLGTSRPDGSLEPEPAARRMRWAFEALLERYPEANFRVITEASFEFLSPEKNPRAVFSSSLTYSMVEPLLEQAGFEAETIAMPSYPIHPDVFYTIVATKLDASSE